MKKSLHNLSIQSIIFDLDGTLIDTEPSAAQAVEECFAHWKIELLQEDARFVTGRTWESAFDYIFSKYSLPLPRKKIENAVSKRYREILENHLVVVPGSVQAVKNLSQNYSLALVSGSTREEVLWALRKLEIENHFQIILGAEDYPRSKPQPDGFLKALQHLNCPPEKSLIFEDSTAGITAARTAGTWIAAITSTNHFQQDQSLAHFKIRDLREVDTSWVQALELRA